MKCNKLFLQFLTEELVYLEDYDLYTMYKSYMRSKVKAFEDNNSLNYEKYKEITEVLREEILRRCN